MDDPMHNLLNKLDYIINIHDRDYDKIEIIIKNNDLYEKLDLDEQMLVLDITKEKLDSLKNNSKNELKKKNNEIKNNEIKNNEIKNNEIKNNEIKNNEIKNNEIKNNEIKNNEIKNIEEKIEKIDIKPSYSDVKPFLKKNNYNFGKVKTEQIMVQNNDGKMISEGESLSSKSKAVILGKITEKEYEDRTKLFNKIKSIILPAQRSQEWYEARNLRVTGSDAGCVLGMNKHEPQYNFILKKVLGATFEGNAACYHGKKLEQVVTLMYELENNVKVEEFGLLSHETNDILAASPDGICTPFCRDGITASPLVGRMLEIKCPTMRKIKYDGDIKDTICPIYYWCQIQQQLECVNFDECDFVQCNIEEYVSRKEWLEDTNTECEYKSKKYGLERGLLIELLPIKLEDSDYKFGGYADLTIWNKTTYLYPPKIDMSLKELDEWVLNELDNLPKDVKLHKIIYWRLVEKNCTLIKRDKEWFQSQLSTYNKIWNYVLYLRENLEVIEEWKNWIDSLPRKYNEKIFAKLDELILKKESKNIKINEDNKIVQEITNKIKKNKK